jgi:hypothetical protein
MVDDKQTMVIGISKRLGLPAMVTVNKNNRFYRRKISGKYPVDLFELNDMFMQNQDLKDKMKAFRYARLSQIDRKEVFNTYGNAPFLVIHIIPYSFQSESNIDLSTAAHTQSSSLIPLGATGCNTRFNIDGFATISTSYRDGNCIGAYNQLFREGIYEIYSANIFQDFQGKIVLDPHSIIFEAINKIEQALTVLKSLGVEAPFAIGYSLVNVYDVVLEYSSHHFTPFKIHRFLLPLTVIDSINQNLKIALRPIYDTVWQAAGFNKCDKL